MRLLSTLSVPALALGTALGGVAGPAAAQNCTQPAINCQSPDQMGHGGGGTVGATSDANLGAGFSVVDNFSPAADGNVTSVCWYGFYIDFSSDPGGAFDCGPGTGDQFNITYYANGSAAGVPGIPGAQIATFQNVVNTKFATGNVIASGIGDIAEYEYTVTHNPVAVLAGECYWIEIQNFTTGTCFWLWESAPAGDNLSFQDVDSNGFDAAEAGDFELAFCLDIELVADLTPCLPPANNTCQTATVIGDGSHPVDNTNATTNGPAEGSCPSGVQSDIWYRYAAVCDGNVTVSLCGSAFDSILAIYQQICPLNANTAIACNDGFCGDDAEVTFFATGGQTYYFRVGGTGGDQGTGTLVVTGPGCIPAPANDDCSAALFTSSSSNPFDSTGATSDGPTETGCDPFGNDIWYRIFNNSCNDDITLSVTSGAFDAAVAVYGSVCPVGPDTAIACDASAGNASVTFTPAINTLYRIRVGSTDGSTGLGTLDITCGTALPCPGDTNGSGTVDVTDLVNVILDWGTDGSLNNGDVDGSGVVDVTDLVMVITGWGACP